MQLANPEVFPVPSRGRVSVGCGLVCLA